MTFQVDSNWYEGERNAMLGIFPTTYVEIIPQDAVASQVLLVITEDVSYLRICLVISDKVSCHIREFCIKYFCSSGEHPLQERAKHGWSGKGEVQLHRANPNGGLLPQR